MPARLKEYYHKIEIWYFRWIAFVAIAIWTFHYILLGDELTQFEKAFHYCIIAGLLIVSAWTFIPPLINRFLYISEMGFLITGQVYFTAINILNGFPCKELLTLFFYTFGCISFPRQNEMAFILLLLTNISVIAGLIINKNVFCTDPWFIGIMFFVNSFIPFFGVFSFNRIAQQLNRARKLNEALFDNYYDAILLVDHFTKKIKNCNNAAIALLGYSSKDEVTSLFLQDIGIELHKEPLNVEFQKGLATTGFYRWREKIKKKNGETFWADVACIPFYYANTQFFVFRINNINEWVKTEEQLQASAQFYKLIYENSRAGIFTSVFDTGEIKSCNKAFAEILGYDNQSDIIGKYAKEFYLSETDRESLLRELTEKKFLKDVKVKLKTRDNRVITVLENLLLINHEGTDLIQGTVVDITPLEEYTKMIESKIHEFELMLGKIGVATYHAILFPDGTKEIRYLSRNTVEIFGFEPEDRISGKVKMQDYILEEDLKAVEDGVQYILKTYAPGRFIYRIKHLKTGQIKWIEEIRMSIKNELSGEILTYGMCRDITYLKPERAMFHIIEQPTPS